MAVKAVYRRSSVPLSAAPLIPRTASMSRIAVYERSAHGTRLIRGKENPMTTDSNTSVPTERKSIWLGLGFLVFLGVVALVFFVLGGGRLRHRYYELHQHQNPPAQLPNRIDL